MKISIFVIEVQRLVLTIHVVEIWMNDGCSIFRFGKGGWKNTFEFGLQESYPKLFRRKKETIWETIPVLSNTNIVRNVRFKYSIKRVTVITIIQKWCSTRNIIYFISNTRKRLNYSSLTILTCRRGLIILMSIIILINN